MVEEPLPSALDTLKQSIAKGDADLAAGRSKTYAPGELARELKDGLSPRRPLPPILPARATNAGTLSC